jgi:hypothetical protein
VLDVCSLHTSLLHTCALLICLLDSLVACLKKMCTSLVACSSCLLFAGMLLLFGVEALHRHNRSRPFPAERQGSGAIVKPLAQHNRCTLSIVWVCFCKRGLHWIVNCQFAIQCHLLQILNGPPFTKNHALASHSETFGSMMMRALKDSTTALASHRSLGLEFEKLLWPPRLLPKLLEQIPPSCQRTFRVFETCRFRSPIL